MATGQAMANLAAVWTIKLLPLSARTGSDFRQEVSEYIHHQNHQEWWSSAKCNRDTFCRSSAELNSSAIFAH